MAAVFPTALFIPGVVELVSVLVVLSVTFGIPLVVAIVVYQFYRRFKAIASGLVPEVLHDGTKAYEERIADLERRVEQLERDRSDE